LNSPIEGIDFSITKAVSLLELRGATSVASKLVPQRSITKPIKRRSPRLAVIALWQQGWLRQRTPIQSAASVSA
jgi:hypothetical protein